MSAGLSIERLKAILPEVVEALPPVERAIVNALFWERLTLQQVADITGQHRTTIMRVRDRAFERIRGLCDDDD